MKTLEFIPTVEAEEVRNEFSWEVNQTPIYDPSGKPISGYKVLTRSDNNQVLNVCKDSYEPTKNEVFCELVFKVAALSGYTIENFNEFQQGKKVLAFLKAPETYINGFQIDNYLTLGNSHDSSSALFMANTQQMIRCANQFSDLSKRALKVYHTSGQNERIQAIESIIRLYNNNQRQIQRNYEKLQSEKADSVSQDLFIRHMFDIEPGFDESKVNTRTFNNAADLNECIETEKADLGFNKFALLNGVTRWTTHVRKQKETTFGNVFGANANYNTKAMNFLLN